MRHFALALALLVGASSLVVGCCKKSADSNGAGGASPAATAAATTTATARPCSGMASDKDCSACCGGGYRHTFHGTGTCTCTH